MKKQKSPVAELAMRIIKSEVLKEPFEITNEIKHCEELQIEAGCYISVHTQNGELRAFHGTQHPTEESLYYEVIRNAKNTVNHDAHYKPISAHELENILIAVDVLGVPYRINDLAELDPIHKGIIISHGGKKAILLPNAKGIETPGQQLEAAKQKAGLEYVENSELQISIFTSTRFE